NTQFIRNELTITAKVVTWFWLARSRSAYNLLSNTGSDNTTVNWDNSDTFLLNWFTVFDWFAVGFLVAVGHFVIGTDAKIIPIYSLDETGVEWQWESLEKG
ncbi:hypothetical protein BC833DRAFT_570695, partial [Globomyces pollinis-pini]